MAATTIATGVVLAAYYLDVPLRVDETTTIGAYTAQPLSTALTEYDTPNNHLLHTLLVWVVTQVGGLSRVVFRLPAFASFCLFLIVLWWFVRLEYGAKTATFTVALVAPSPIFIGFATNARGYTLLLLLFVTALLCGRAVLRSPHKNALWAAWAATVALGCYTVPVMVFPASTTAAWMLLVRWRRRGDDGLGFRPFAFRTIAWSGVALGAVAALYLPVALTERGDGLTEMMLKVDRYLEMSLLRGISHPVMWWRHWHFTTPAWAQGVLLGLVAVGAVAAGRSCGRRGTLLWAAALGWMVMLALAYPVVKQSRYALWLLLVCKIMAGAGLALVLTRALARARVRWPSVFAAPCTRMLECVAPVPVLVSVLWWTIQPGAVTRATAPHYAPREVVPAMASAVVERLEAGDYFTICRSFAPRIVLYVSEFHATDQGIANYRPLANSSHRMSVNRVSVEVPIQSASAPSPTAFEPEPAERSTGRLFVFSLLNGKGESLCSRFPPAGKLLEAQRLDHELVASIRVGSAQRSGRVYLLHDWAPS